MRFAVVAMPLMLVLPLVAQERKVTPRDIDRQMFDALKEVHNRGADLYNEGRASDCYRLYQGSLATTRAALAHRPAEQKFIDDALKAADRRPTTADRAFALHESIETLRKRLRDPIKDAGPELLGIPPREYKLEKPVPKKLMPPKDGVMGVILWNGQPLTKVDVTFVSRGALIIRVIEGASDAEGRYVLSNVKPGKYTVLLSQPGDKKSVLPERYATATNSPLIVDVKGGGDQLDFMLQ